MTSAKRVRRTPEEARRLILDAAETCMASAGPAGLRLQEVAEAAGVSHPTILHHFESREGLIRALNRRTLDDLDQVLREQMESKDSNGGSVRAAFAAYRDGFAHRIVWMIQSGAWGGEAGFKLFDATVDRLHALRCALAPDGLAPPRSDSEAVVHLVTISAFGDALIGQRLRQAQTEEGEVKARERFEDWLADLILNHVQGFRTPPPP